MDLLCYVERQEGIRVKTSAGANRQAALPGRASDPSVLTFLRETEVGRMMTLARGGVGGSGGDSVVAGGGGRPGRGE